MTIYAVTINDLKDISITTFKLPRDTDKMFNYLRNNINQSVYEVQIRRVKP